jgi:gamma-glutamylaminecyclotransferase
MKHTVFVYGTLKQGYGNYARILAGNSNFLGTAVTDGKFKMLDSGFPVLLSVQSGGKHVAGEVFEVNDAVLKRLDQLEGEGSMYDRKLVTVQMESGEFVQAYIYIGCDRCWRSPRQHYAKSWTKVNEQGQWEWSR